MKSAIIYFVALCSIVRCDCIFKVINGTVTNECFNPDGYLNAPQIIRRHGYQSESHIVQTEDGYLLTVHRIPSSKNGTKGKQPVFLQHGLLGSSADWVDGVNRSLAFLLSDMGYDVWLGNVRGNSYSKAHISIPPDSAQFWNFSWHEMGTLDLPVVVSFIADATGKAGEILYVGHSMGTTMFFVFASKLPEAAKNIKAMVALAPIAFMTHIKSPIKYLAPWADDIAFIEKYLGLNQFLPSNKVISLLARDCLEEKPSKICANLIFTLFGFDKLEIDDDILEVILQHDPAGTSTKTVMHYLQEIRDNGIFQNYDYGAKGNMIQYGRPTPPPYKLENIKVPTYLMYANNDNLANPIDVKRLSANLTNNIGVYEVPLPYFNHGDFLWGKDAPALVFEPLLKVFKNYTSDK